MNVPTTLPPGRHASPPTSLRRPLEASAAVAHQAPRGVWRLLLCRLPIAPLGILFLFVLAAFFAPWVAPHPPTAVDLSKSLTPPAWQRGGTSTYVFGTDELGRDILSRIIWGARVTLTVIVAAVVGAGAIGVALGLVAGFRRGWTETLLMRLVDLELSLPTILLALLFGVLFRPGLTPLLIVIILNLWATYARQAHAETVTLAERDFVMAVRALGATEHRILLKHILPNLVNSIVVVATSQIAAVGLMAASLSFLGVGVPPPTPEWGLMVSEGQQVLTKAWWVATFPGTALALVVLSAFLTGDWLRDYLDPTLRRR